MEQKKVTVFETGNVNQLAIENTSAETVYVQGGDIVKGGQQDRVFTTDLVLPPKSGTWHEEKGTAGQQWLQCVCG